MIKATGDYILPRGLEGKARSLFEIPIVLNDSMPKSEIPYGLPVIANGNFDRGYQILDRLGTQILLRDPVDAQADIGFRTT